METAQSIDEHLNQHGRSGSDVPAAKSKYGSHKSLSATNSASDGHRKSHPLLSSRYSNSDSRLSSSFDNLSNPKRGSRFKRRVPRLDLSLDSNPKGLRHGRQDPNSTTESTEDEDRTSADEYSCSTEDDADCSLRHGEGDAKGGDIRQHESINCSVNSTSSYVDKAVEELVTTERTYVRDLHDVIQVGVIQYNTVLVAIML